MEENVPDMETGADRFPPWITVDQAYAYAIEKGIPRTKKTFRKWCSRPDTLTCRKQDTQNGFRYLIDRASLDIKLAEEKEQKTAGENRSEPVHTSANQSEPVSMTKHNEKQIKFLQEQIVVKDGQMKIKDEQITQMLQSTRETNILMRDLHNMLRLNAPDKSSNIHDVSPTEGDNEVSDKEKHRV